MDEKMAWRFGFLLRCAEAGLDEVGAEHLASLTKRAIPGLSDAKDLVTSAVSGILGAVKTVGLLGGGLALAGGAGAGVMLAKAQEGSVNEEDVRRQELIATYNAYGDRVRHRRAGLAPASLQRYAR